MNITKGLISAGLVGILASCGYETKANLAEVIPAVEQKPVKKLYDVVNPKKVAYKKEIRDPMNYLEERDGKKFMRSEDFMASQTLKPGVYAPEVLGISGLDKGAILLDFWYTSCAPCKELMPAIEEFYNRCKSEGLEVISIVSKSEQKNLDEFLKKKSFPYRLVFDESNTVLENGDIRAAPTLIFLEDGIVKGIKIGGGEKAEEWLKNLENRILKK
ncbi:MAG: TlpA disulfide reductase family protein [Candidatus Nanoarchaeia archaeon]|nr:TlpA disulfide reductase family protein [Candidatus Nanoarchaeia archaeon]